MFAAGYIEDAKLSYDLSLKSGDFYATIGVHPCRANEPFKHSKNEDPQKVLTKYFDDIRNILRNSEHKGKFVAIGECGLDYDRFDYADKETQLMVFPPHFELTEEFNLPMYLHSRNTGGDFNRIIKENRSRFPGGVVHFYGYRARPHGDS